MNFQTRMGSGGDFPTRSAFRIGEKAQPAYAYKAETHQTFVEYLIQVRHTAPRGSYKTHDMNSDVW